MQEKETNQAIFSHLDFREILLTFLFKTIKGDYKRATELKRAINKAYNKRGIDQAQRDGLLMSLELEELHQAKRYQIDELLTLLDRLLTENYITSLDYVIGLRLGASLGVFSDNRIEHLIKAHDINPNSFKENIEEIVKDLRTL